MTGCGAEENIHKNHKVAGDTRNYNCRSTMYWWQTSNENIGYLFPVCFTI
jgi:hypothetical protein